MSDEKALLATSWEPPTRTLASALRRLAPRERPVGPPRMSSFLAITKCDSDLSNTHKSDRNWYEILRFFQERCLTELCLGL